MPKLVTREDVRTIVAVSFIIIAIVFAWANLNNIAINAEKHASEAHEKTNELVKVQGDMALDIREIKTILKQKGLTMSTIPYSTKTAAASATPTPAKTQEADKKEPNANQASAYTYNYYQAPTPAPTPITAPVPTPTPTPFLLQIFIPSISL